MNEKDQKVSNIQLFIKNAPVAIAMFDRNMCYLAASNRWMVDYHLTYDDIIGRSHYDIFPEIPDQWKVAHQSGLAGNVVGNQDDCFEREDGTLQWLRWEIQPWSEPDGSVGGIILFTEDITERKQAENALRESEERLKFALRGSQLGFWDWNLETNEVNRNERWAAMLGYKLQEIEFTVKQWLDFIHPDDRFIAYQSIQDHLEGRTPMHQAEYRMLAKDGQSRWILDQAQVVKWDSHGRPIRMSGTHTDITERKQAEAALQEAEWKFQALFEKGPIGVSYNEMIYDTSGGPIDWRILDFNESYKELTGVDPENKTLLQAFPGIENDPFDWIGKLGHVARTGESIRFEQYLQMNGRWYDIAAYQYKPDHFVTAFMEITERKRAEEELRKSEAHLRTLVQTIPDLIWLKDQDGVYLSCNKIFERLFGAGTEDIVGKTDYDFVDRELADFFRAHDQKAIAAGIPSKNEEWVTFSDDGHRALLETIKTPMYDDKGALVGVLGIGRDITERKRNEEVLQHYTFLMKEMGKAAKIGGWEFDAATGTGTWTEEVALIHEVDPKEAMSVETEISFYTDESKEKITRAIQDAVESAKPYILELELITANGNHKWVKIIGHPITENNKVVKVRGSFQDITERKQADKEREKLQLQLTQAQKMESVGRLAGGVAHDFNNMLGVILGYSELALAMTEENQDLHSALKEIQMAAERSADLTRQLLAFARKQTVVPKVIDLNITVESMLSMLRRLIGEDISLVWLPRKKTGLIKIDPSQIDQILANLCVNARDAISDNGKVTVETDSVKISEIYQTQHIHFQPGKYVLLAVSDNGCGMSEEIQRKLFEPFFTTKEMGKGTGLGLASVYGIVKQNNGYINVYSELGVGTTFKIYLPLHETNEDQLHKSKLMEPAIRGDETILLAEDEPAILKMTSRMLEKLGYKVLKANIPTEAIDLACAHAEEIQLLMTDVIMPEINGRALAKSLLPIIPGLKCLFMSGYTSNVIAHHGVLDEGVLFIQKPFNMRDLAAKIREALCKDPD